MKATCLNFFLAAALFTSARAAAAPVAYWFAGTVDDTNNPGGTLPASIAPGTPFFGPVS